MATTVLVVESNGLKLLKELVGAEALRCRRETEHALSHGARGFAHGSQAAIADLQMAIDVGEEKSEAGDLAGLGPQGG